MLHSKAFIIASLCLLAISKTTASSDDDCVQKDTALTCMDVVEDLVTKAKNLFPNFTDVETSECGAKDKASAYLDLAKTLILEAKKSYPTCKDPNLSRDCSDVYQKGHNVSGVYTIWPSNLLFMNGSLEVFCDMETDGGGWTVVQRRGDFKPQEIFYRNWNAYKLGFGNLKRDFWLGNDNLFVLSNQGKYKIQFDLESADGEKAYAVYETFRVEHEENEYKIHIGNYSGTAGDSMSYHSGQLFSTKDRDNERSYIKAGTSCASRFKSGWWFHQSGGICAESDLNSVYKPGGTKRPFMRWKEWKAFSGLAATKIKIKAI